MTAAVFRKAVTGSWTSSEVPAAPTIQFHCWNVSYAHIQLPRVPDQRIRPRPARRERDQNAENQEGEFAVDFHVSMSQTTRVVGAPRTRHRGARSAAPTVTGQVTSCEETPRAREVRPSGSRAVAPTMLSM